MGLLDKAEELEEKSEDEEEEEYLDDEEPVRRKKKGKKKGAGKKKKGGLSGLGKKKKGKKRPVEDDDDDFYSKAPREKKPRKKKGKKKTAARKRTAEEDIPGESQHRIDPRTLPYAPLWKRFAAAAIDYGLLLVVFFGILVLFIQDAVDNRKEMPLYWLLITTILTFMYFLIFDGVMSRSLGKIFFGTEIINQYGDKPTLGEGVFSALGKTITLFPIIPVIDMIGLFFGRSSRYYQRKTEHAKHLFVVDRAKFRGRDKPIGDDDDYFAAMDNED